MRIVEAALGQPVIREPDSDPYVRADPISVYVSGHDFDDGDIDSPAGSPVALKTAYPHLLDVRATDKDLQRQQDTAARIFAAIQADDRLRAVYVDDMQRVLGTHDPAASQPNG